MTAEHSFKLDCLSETMLSLLPGDGTPVLNRVMCVMLARGLIGRMRGHSGRMMGPLRVPEEQSWEVHAGPGGSPTLAPRWTASVEGGFPQRRARNCGRRLERQHEKW